MDEVLQRRTHSIAMIVMSATLRKDLIRHALRARHLPLRGEGKKFVLWQKERDFVPYNIRHRVQLTPLPPLKGVRTPGKQSGGLFPVRTGRQAPKELSAKLTERAPPAGLSSQRLREHNG